MATSVMSKELTAMSAVETGLAGLEQAELERVLRWACERFGVQAAKALAHAGGNGPPKGADVGAAAATDDSDSLAEFFGQIAPETEADKALVVAYWHQFKEGNVSFESSTINGELKNLGHGVGNITQAFNALKNAKPQLVVQLQKSGTTRQARKTFKVTVAGKKAVEQMASGDPEE